MTAGAIGITDPEQKSMLFQTILRALPDGAIFRLDDFIKMAQQRHNRLFPDNSVSLDEISSVVNETVESGILKYTGLTNDIYISRGITHHIH